MTLEKYDILLDSKVQQRGIQDILKLQKKTILYFYPKDNTPGCTLEAKDFSCQLGEFLRQGIQVVGVSKDNIESHKKFYDSQELNIILISDPELVLHKHFGVYGEKNNYGKISMGVIRSTFLLDENGNILKEWRNVKATGHVEKVLREISQ